MQVSTENLEEKKVKKKKLPTVGFKGKGIEISYNKTHQAEQQHWKRLYCIFSSTKRPKESFLQTLFKKHSQKQCCLHRRYISLSWNLKVNVNKKGFKLQKSSLYHVKLNMVRALFGPVQFLDMQLSTDDTEIKWIDRFPVSATTTSTFQLPKDDATRNVWNTKVDFI